MATAMVGKHRQQQQQQLPPAACCWQSLEVEQEGLMSVPLCIRENRLDDDDYVLSSSSSSIPASCWTPNGSFTITTTQDPRISSSPTSVIELVSSLPLDQRQECLTGHGGRKEVRKGLGRKKPKKRLFRKGRKRKEKETTADRIKKEAQRLEALRFQQIQQEEDADFQNLRDEEECSPKLDMLVKYPLTLMEEVMSMPVPEMLPRKRFNSGEDTEDSTSLEEDDSDLQNSTAVQVFSKVKAAEHELKPLDLGRFEEAVKSLRISKIELHYFISLKNKFSQLQKELRGRGVITNETLRQKLHILCRRRYEEDESECSDLFSGLLLRRAGYSKNLSLAYRRMNEVTTEIDWKREIEDVPTMNEQQQLLALGVANGTLHAGGFGVAERSSMKSQEKWSDRKLLSCVSNYSQKGRESYHTQFQDGVEEQDMLAYDRGGFREGVDLLTYCVHDLVPIVEEDQVFSNLQKELRRIGAVTNEVLKQGLHFYVRDVRLQKEREEAALRQLEDKEGSSKEEKSSLDELNQQGNPKHRSLLKKMRFRNRRHI